jgi:DNA-binding CsgD family transcriptional regulator
MTRSGYRDPVRAGVSTAGSASLVERDDVLAELGEHLVAASAGQARLVLLPGEAGVGKTTVLDHFGRSVSATAEVLRGWCDPLSTPRPFGPWLDIAPDLGLDISDEPSGVSTTFRLVLDALAGSRTRVVILEDVHWADAATLDLLRLLARRIGDHPVLLVASYRDDEIGPDHPLRVLLGDLVSVPAIRRCPVHRLSPDGVAALAAGGSVDADELYRITGGNPFFVTEVLGTEGQGIPATVGAALAGRLARVSPEAREIAEAVAVLGSSASMTMMTGLVGDPCPALPELVGAGVLNTTGDGLGYRHELARMAVLDAIPAFRQAATHRRVLELLRADATRSGDTVLLAHHADAAGDVAAVLEYAPRAAEQAAAAGAYREAAAQYRRALRVGAALPPDRRAHLLEGFAQASALSSQVADALAGWQDAVELRRGLGDRLNEGANLRYRSWLLWPSGRCAEARRAGELAVQVLETLPPSPELAWAQVNLCQLNVYDQLGPAAVDDLARPAAALGSRLGVDEVVWQAEFHRAMVRHACAADADASAVSWAGMQGACEAATRAGQHDAAAFFGMMMAWYAVIERDHERASSALRVVERVGLDRDIQLYQLFVGGHRGFGLFNRGSWDEAAELCAGVLAHPNPLPVARVLPLVVLALVRARRGDPDTWTLLDEAEGISDATIWTLLVAAARAEVAWLDGDAARARLEARRGLATATEHTDRWLTGPAVRWLALADGDRPAVGVAGPIELELAGDWAGAAARWDRLGCPYDAAVARLSGDVPALLAAFEAFEALGARPAVAIAQSRLRALGVRTWNRGPRASTLADPHGLTTRQREILALVGEGMTDPQIAARLHLSAKTVGHHVGAALTKLGVHSRAEAVARLEPPR